MGKYRFEDLSDSSDINTSALQKKIITLETVEKEEVCLLLLYLYRDFYFPSNYPQLNDHIFISNSLKSMIFEYLEKKLDCSRDLFKPTNLNDIKDYLLSSIDHEMLNLEAFRENCNPREILNAENVFFQLIENLIKLKFFNNISNRIKLRLGEFYYNILCQLFDVYGAEEGLLLFKNWGVKNNIDINSLNRAKRRFSLYLDYCGKYPLYLKPEFFLKLSEREVEILTQKKLSNSLNSKIKKEALRKLNSGEITHLKELKEFINLELSPNPVLDTKKIDKFIKDFKKHEKHLDHDFIKKTNREINDFSIELKDKIQEYKRINTILNPPKFLKDSSDI